MEYYILRLWDCATPSFCSFDKIYVGTEADIRKAIASMKRAGVNDETVTAVSHYLAFLALRYMSISWLIY